MRIRLYFDEDSMDRMLIRALRVRGVDVETAFEEQLIEVSDEDHLEFATSRGRVLCSFNVGDFYHLHTLFLQQDRHHAGILLSRQQAYSVGDQMRRILRLMSERTAEEMRDRVEFLGAWGG